MKTCVVGDPTCWPSVESSHSCFNGQHGRWQYLWPEIWVGTL